MVGFGEATNTEIVVNRGVGGGKRDVGVVGVLSFLVVANKSLKSKWQRHRSNPYAQAKRTRGQQLMNIAFSMHWHDYQSIIHKMCVSPQVRRCSWETMREIQVLLDIQESKWFFFPSAVQ